MSIDKHTLGAMYSFAKYGNSRKGIDNMIALARSDLAVGLEMLDTDPWLFNVENGTIDLRTGEIREHRREDFITKLAPVTFDPDADCPLWRSFTDTIFDGNEELAGYVQRLVGYCLTGVTAEQVFPFLYGIGANGKSTFCEMLMSLIGADYAMKAGPDLLITKRGESHPTERADLFGKRFVACVESEEGRQMAEVLVKELTGGDRIRARRMREDFWEFVPTHHVWLASNHKPRVLGNDHGIWRRIKLIPFLRKFWDPAKPPEPGEDRDPKFRADKQLKTKLVAELPGILNWAIAGCLDWQRDGLREPAIVCAKTYEYAEEEDLIGQFIADYCEQGPEFLAPATELHKTYVEETGDKISAHCFTAKLRQRGFLDKDPATGKEYRTKKGERAKKGLRLREEGLAEDIAERSKVSLEREQVDR